MAVRLTKEQKDELKEYLKKHKVYNAMKDKSEEVWYKYQIVLQYNDLGLVRK